MSDSAGDLVLEEFYWKVSEFRRALDLSMEKAKPAFSEAVLAWFALWDSIRGIRRVIKTVRDFDRIENHDSKFFTFRHAGEHHQLQEIASPLVEIAASDLKKPGEFKNWLYDVIMKPMFDLETKLLWGPNAQDFEKDPVRTITEDKEIWVLGGPKAYTERIVNPLSPEQSILRFKAWESVFIPKGK